MLLDSDHHDQQQQQKSGQDQTTLLYERDEQLRRQRQSSPSAAGQTELECHDDGHDNDDQLLKLLPFDDGSDGKELQHLSSARLHQLLKKVDPVMADSIHPNNRRKIVR